MLLVLKKESNQFQKEICSQDDSVYLGDLNSGHLEIYEICQPLFTIKKCLSASSQQIISAQAIQYCRQINSYWILLRQ